MKIRKAIQIQIRNMPRSLRVGVLLLMTGVLTLSIIPVDSIFAAVTQESPVRGDVSSGGTPGAVSHLLKFETVAKIPTLKLGAYFVSDTPGLENFRIRYSHGVAGTGKKCFIEPQVIAAGGNLRVTITSGANSRVYKVPVSRICADVGGTPRDNLQDNGGNGWTNNKFFGNYAFPNTLAYDEATGYFKATIVIDYPQNYANPDGSPRATSMQSNVNFVTSISQANAKLAPLGSASNNEFGLRSDYIEENRRPNVNVAVQFGIACDSVARTFPIRFYDPDPGTFGPNAFFWVSKNGNPLPANAYGPGGNPEAGSNNAEWVPGRSAFRATAPSGSSSLIMVDEAEKNATYRMHIQALDMPAYAAQGGNVISLDLPYDGIYASVDCAYDLNPATQVNTPRYSYYPNISLNGSVDKDGEGPITSDHPWEIYTVRYTTMPNLNIEGDSAGAPCNRPQAANRVPNSCQRIFSGATRGDANQPMNYSSGGPDAIGTRLCFFTRVQNPTESPEDDATWRYSKMRCSVAGIYPRAQVWGYDARVMKQIETSLHFMQSRQYGSWSEYGLFSGGLNTGMASASGLNTGSTDTAQNQWSNLTFANRGPGGDAQFGTFGYFSFPTVAQAATPPGDPKCNFSLTSATPVVVQAGARCVFRVAGNLNITSNITYANGPYTNIKDIPRVIIIADNISIANNATQIDPWIVATNKINTCTEATGGVFTSATNLTAAACRNRLTFNGAVIANTMYLHRTTEPGVTQDLSGEIFNLRADAFLSTFAGNGNGTIATTDSITELPPRF